MICRGNLFLIVGPIVNWDIIHGPHRRKDRSFAAAGGSGLFRNTSSMPRRCIPESEEVGIQFLSIYKDFRPQGLGSLGFEAHRKRIVTLPDFYPLLLL